MADALVLSMEGIKTKNKVPEYGRISCTNWFRGFSPSLIKVGRAEIIPDFFLYIISMPCPEEFFSKNRLGKRKTMKKWFEILKEKEIHHYLLEESLLEYLEEKDFSNENQTPEKRLWKKSPLLFGMEPLAGLKPETLTIAISGLRQEDVTDDLTELLRHYKQVITLEEGAILVDFWEEFMTETGVPVCRTADYSALQRSDIWISFSEDTAVRFFKGVKVDMAEGKIILPDKCYRIGYTFHPEMNRKLGSHVFRVFHPHHLANFLLCSLRYARHELPASAEELLRIKIRVTPDER